MKHKYAMCSGTQLIFVSRWQRRAISFFFHFCLVVQTPVSCIKFFRSSSEVNPELVADRHCAFSTVRPLEQTRCKFRSLR